MHPVQRPRTRSSGIDLIALAAAIGLVWLVVGLVPAAHAQQEPEYFEQLQQAIAEFEAGLRDLAAKQARIATEREALDQQERQARQEEARLRERRDQAQRELDQARGAGQQPQPVAPSQAPPAGPELSEDEIAVLADTFPHGQKANAAVNAAQDQVDQAQVRKDDADARAEGARGAVSDAMGAPPGDWKTERAREEQIARLQATADKADTEARQAAEQLEEEQRRLDAQRAERRALVEYEELAGKAGQGQGTQADLDQAWDKVKGAAQEVVNAGGTPTIVSFKDSTPRGEVADPQEQQRRAERRDLAQQRRDGLSREIGELRRTRNEADAEVQAAQEELDLWTRRRDDLRRGRGKKAGDPDKLHRAERKVEEAQTRLDRAKERRDRADAELRGRQEQRDRLGNLIDAIDGVVDKEAAVEKAKGEGGTAEAEAREELGEAQQEQAAAEEALGDPPPTDDAEPTTPENSLAGGQPEPEAEPEKVGILADGATVLPVAPDLTTTPAELPVIGVQTGGTTDDDTDGTEEEQQRTGPDPIVLQDQQQFTAPDPALKGPAGNPCSDQQASAFCGGKVDGGGILGQPVGGDRNPPREPCPGTEGSWACAATRASRTSRSSTGRRTRPPRPATPAPTPTSARPVGARRGRAAPVRP